MIFIFHLSFFCFNLFQHSVFNIYFNFIKLYYIITININSIHLKNLNISNINHLIYEILLYIYSFIVFMNKCFILLYNIINIFLIRTKYNNMTKYKRMIFKYNLKITIFSYYTSNMSKIIFQFIYCIII